MTAVNHFTFYSVHGYEGSVSSRCYFQGNMNMLGILSPIRENWTKEPFTETYLENQTTLNHKRHQHFFPILDFFFQNYQNG